jgi:hypothetical protein
MPNADMIHGDRRADRRYAFEMPLHFSCQGRQLQSGGSGSTKDLCRKGILFVSDDPPPADTDVELRIEWPFLLQNVCPLELLVRGRVLRSDWRGTVIRMKTYEFRSCGNRSFDQASAGAGNLNIFA